MQKGKDLYPEIHEIRRTDRKSSPLYGLVSIHIALLRRPAKG
jgi:hypothetical protein